MANRNIDTVLEEERKKKFKEEDFSNVLGVPSKSKNKSNFQPNFQKYQTFKNKIAAGVENSPNAKYLKFKNTMDKQTLKLDENRKATETGIPAGATKGYGTSLHPGHPIKTVAGIFGIEGYGIDEQKSPPPAVNGGSTSFEEASFEETQRVAAKDKLTDERINRVERSNEKQARKEIEQAGDEGSRGDYYRGWMHGTITL